jgi:hypothetical protein
MAIHQPIDVINALSQGISAPVVQKTEIECRECLKHLVKLLSILVQA